MRTSLFVVTLLLLAASLRAQDVLTIGTGSAPSGGTVQIPVYFRDRSGTSLDSGAGVRPSAVTFKIFTSPVTVASVSFVRAGVAAAPVPLWETTLTGVGYISWAALFSESNPINFNLDAAAPGDQIGTLTVTLQSGVAVGTVIPLRFDAPSAIIASQSSSVRETIAAGNLSLVNGSVTTNALAVPTNLVATVNGTQQVNLTWTAVNGSDHYEVWRSFNAGGFTQLASPSGTSHQDNSVSAGITYLYRVRAVSASNEMSGFSNTDAATTISFTDPVLVAQSSVIRAVHFNELRTAVNAMRTSVSLPAIGSDVAIGAIVAAQHLATLRSGLDQARSQIGMPAIAYTEPSPTVIKRVHVQELRDGTQ